MELKGKPSTKKRKTKMLKRHTCKKHTKTTIPLEISITSSVGSFNFALKIDLCKHVSCKKYREGEFRNGVVGYSRKGLANISLSYHIIKML